MLSAFQTVRAANQPGASCRADPRGNARPRGTIVGRRLFDTDDFGCGQLPKAGESTQQIKMDPSWRLARAARRIGEARTPSHARAPGAAPVARREGTRAALPGSTGHGAGEHGGALPTGSPGSAVPGRAVLRHAERRAPYPAASATLLARSPTRGDRGRSARVTREWCAIGRIMRGKAVGAALTDADPVQAG